MKVQVDRERCVGHGRCYVLCPQVFDEDEEGYAVVTAAEVPAALEEKVLLAADNCPEHAIAISEAQRS